MLKAVLLLPAQAASLAAFLYLFGGGWLVIPPTVILGAFQ